MLQTGPHFGLVATGFAVVAGAAHLQSPQPSLSYLVGSTTQQNHNYSVTSNISHSFPQKEERGTP
jgi:hypothetical protein